MSAETSPTTPSHSPAEPASIALAGATGDLGFHIAQALLDRGAAVRALGKANIRVVPLARGRKLVVYRVPDGRGRGKRLGARGRGLSFRRGTDIPIFLMVPVVRLAKRLDFEGTQDRVPGILAAELEAALARG